MKIRKKHEFLKLLPLLAIAIFGIQISQAQTAREQVTKSFTVTGSVEFIDSTSNSNKIYLYREQMNGESKAIDSVLVSEKNKSFVFHVKQDHPSSYYIDAMMWDRAYFWGDANVSTKMRGYDTGFYKVKIPHYNFVQGSMDNNFINLYEQISQLNYLRMIDEYNESYHAAEHKEKDSAWITYLNNTPRYDSLTKDYDKRMELLLQVYEGRPVTLYGLRRKIGVEDGDKYEAALKPLNDLIKKFPWLTEAKEAKKTILTNREMALKIRPGNDLPVVSYPDENGKLSGLEKYRGKYLLIDFWASWCGPCRQAVPQVKELYKEYKSKGLEVVSISIDKDKKAWEKALDEEEMPWGQMLSTDIAETQKIFQFGGVPTIYFIDPAGKIIKSYLGYGPEVGTDIKRIIDNGIVAPPVGGKVMQAAGF